MVMRDIKDKPETRSVGLKRPETDADELRKIVSLAYPAFAMFAKALESDVTVKFSTRAIRRTKVTELPKHLNRAIIAAETYSERDLLCRRLSSYCYGLSRLFMKNQDHKNATKWMTLALRFLRLSLDPKKLQDMDRMEKELAELKAAMKEREEKQGEEDLEEPRDY
jgi:hypothetical protein